MKKVSELQNQIYDVSLKQIQCFLAVAECGSITQAAERLYMTQSVLSKRMMALEEQIQLPLLKREGRSIQLTQTGHFLCGVWKEMLDGYIRNLEEAGRMQRFSVGKFSIGCFPVLDTSAFLYPYLEKLAALSPGLDIKIKRQNWVLLLEDLLKKDLDLAFMLETNIPKGQDCFEFQMVGQCPLIAIVPEQSLLARKDTIEYNDLDGQPLIFSLPEQSPQRISGIHARCVEHHVEASSVRYVNSDVTALLQVELGQGISLGPALFYPESAPHVRMIPVRGEAIHILAVWNKRDIPEVKDLICQLLSPTNLE